MPRFRQEKREKERALRKPKIGRPPKAVRQREARGTVDAEEARKNLGIVPIFQ